MSAQEHQELAIRPVTGNSLSEVMALGKVFKASGYFRDVRDEAQAVTKILYGREIGFTPIVSIMGIHIIEGKPALSSNLLAALIKRSGKYDYRVLESTNQRCEIEFRQGAEVLGNSEFTMEDAQKAGVVREGSGWKKWPKAMLFARALSAGVRYHCPDVTACPLYVPEELGASVTEEGEVTELPKAARPVEVTQEDIPIEPPTKAQGAASGPVAQVVKTQSFNTPEGQDPPPNYHPQVEVEPPKKVVPITPYINQMQDAAKGKKKEPEFITYPGCIDGPRQTNFARSWNDACPKDLKAREKEVFRHDWLARHGYLDEQGNPTSAKIPLAEFEAVKKDAVVFARALGEPARAVITDDDIPF